VVVAIAAWVEGLRKRYGNALLAVCLEQKRGPLVYALCQYENLVLYPINPRTVANYRKAFQPSQAKSDPIDARILVELLRKHGDKLLAWQPESAQMRALRQWVESRRMLVGEKVRLTNRLFQQHRVIRRSAIARRIEQIAASGIPLTEAPGIVEPMQWLVQTLIGQLKLLLVRLTELTLKIDQCFTRFSDATWLATLPGAGEHLAPRLLAAFGEDRTRFDHAQQMMCYFGIASVKESSGNKNWIHWRWSCPIFLRQTFVEWANQSRHHCVWAQAYYKMQRSKGKAHPAAMRSLAFKSIRILFRCWKNREAYDTDSSDSYLPPSGSEPMLARSASLHQFLLMFRQRLKVLKL
jgi:transposase